MRTFIFFWLIGFFALELEARVLEGTARKKSGEVVYLERHTIDTDKDGYSKLIRVEYTKEDKTRFATMTSDFSLSREVPETVFEDTRFKLKSSIKIKNGVVEFEETKDGKRISTKSVPLTDGMVASQGFDNFIRKNFEKIETSPVEFKFGVLQNQDFFSLTGYRKSPSSDGLTEFGIKASSWILRLFADELKVVYDSKTKLLKSFEGRSNILSDLGEAQDVIITYKWNSET